jgi:AAA+ superfamily predicted ATPase
MTNQVVFRTFSGPHPLHTGMTDTTSRVRTVTQTIAGILVMIGGVVTGAVTVLVGEHALYDYVTASVSTVNIGGGVLVTAGVVLLALLMIAVTSFVGNRVAEPRINGRTEYTLIGAAALVGVGAGVVTSITVGISGFNVVVLPSNTGDSKTALALAAIPLLYMYYGEYYTPGSIVTSPDTPDDSGMDPQVVKQKTEGGSIEDTGHPAYPPGEAPQSVGPHRQNSPENSDSDSDVDRRGELDHSELEYNWSEDSGVSFNDIGGMEKLKARLKNEIIRPLEDRERAEKLGVTAPNTILYGPPGTGKTFCARALATELDLPFTILSGADVTSKWINESATKVNTLFTEAQRVAEAEGGAVVFLDELDTVLKNRSDGGSGGHEEDNKVVNEFLNHLEDTGNDVIFIGATNRLESLDDAGVRSGRIDLKIRVGKPDAEARVAVLEQKLSERDHDVTAREITWLASKTEERVAADLEAIVNKAAKRVLTRHGDTIHFEDLEAALKEI